MENDVNAQSRVLWCDGSIAVVYKNRGEVCESDAADASLSLIGNLKGELEAKAGRKLDFLEAVHRIDQPVTGCVLVAFSREVGGSDGQVFAIIVMGIAAAEVVVGLGLVVAMTRREMVLDTDELRTLNG